MILSTVTDEVTPDRSTSAFEKIFTMATDQGVHNFELRMVEAKRFPVVDPAAWERMKALSKKHAITYSAVSPGIFRAPLRSDLLAHHADEVLEMSLTLAGRIGVSTLIIFGVDRATTDTPADFDQVVDVIGRTVDRAATRGFSVQLENMPGTWADTSVNTRAILDAVDRKELGAVWDTGNFFEAEQLPFTHSYDTLRPYIRNVHLKDGRVEDGRMIWQRFGEGVTDIDGQVRRLLADDYAGTVTVEAKCEPHHDEDFVASMGYLRTVVDAAQQGSLVSA